MTILHGKVEKVKLDQKRLEKELDLVLLQKKLENLLISLEESGKDNRSVYANYVDEECERIYKVAENIGAQLKQMAQDLKDRY